MIVRYSNFGDELIDIKHYFIDFRLLILSLKLDYMRHLTDKQHKEFTEYDLSFMVECLNDINSGLIEQQRIFRALIDSMFKMTKKSFKI